MGRILASKKSGEDAGTPWADARAGINRTGTTKIDDRIRSSAQRLLSQGGHNPFWIEPPDSAFSLVCQPDGTGARCKPASTVPPKLLLHLVGLRVDSGQRETGRRHPNGAVTEGDIT